MNWLSRVTLIVVLLALGAGAGFWIGRHGSKEADPESAATQPAEEDKPVVTVTVATIREAEISDSITAYGSVLADPGEVRVLSAQFEARVGRVLATAGEEVAEGAEVIEIEASPDTKVALQEAQAALEAADRDLAQIKQRFEQQLATAQELSQAEQVLRSAKLKRQSLTDRGADKPQHLKSPMAGVISKVDVQEGQIVPAGGPLMEIAAQNRIQVKLGVEPGDAPYLKIGQAVQLRRIDDSNADPIEAKIRLIGKRVDPQTRLVDVLVTLPPDAHLLLDTFISGQMTRESAKGLIVPREALLTEEDGGFVIFTIKDGHAHKHDVHPGIQSKREVQIVADNVKTGDMVALVGSILLEDDMGVEVKEAATEPSTEPATKPEAAP